MQNMFIGFVLAVVSAVFGFFAVGIYQEDQRVLDNGITGRAEVLHRDSYESCRSDGDGGESCETEYYVRYGFYSQAEEYYERRAEVGRDAYRSYGEGTWVDIVYLPENPTESRLLDEKNDAVLGAAAIGVVMGVLSAIFFFQGLRDRRRYGW